MTPHGTSGWLALCTWWVRRNPTYLLSAAAMAVGAKLYLTAPGARAGDIGLILLTLGVLQLYELAVAIILVVLYRGRRSPEDQPSLLLVAALFWTGPLAATLEIHAHDRWLGLGLSAAVCVLALAELWSLRRLLGLCLSPAGRLVAGLCLLLIAGAPLRLRVEYGSGGTDELSLYSFWWLLACVAAFGLPAVRWHAWRARCDGRRSAWTRDLRNEVVLLTIVLSAAGAHLYAMNYTFYGHARAFYAAPLLLAVTLVAFELLAVTGLPRCAFLTGCAGVPILALMLSLSGFDRAVPVEALPVLLRNPRLTILLLAAITWWYGAVRHRRVWLLHAGSAAAASAILLALARPASFPTVFTSHAAPLPVYLSGAAYSAAAYLLIVGAWRRSRRDVLTALLAAVLATSALVWKRTDADLLVILLVAGWGWLLATQLASGPRRWGTSIPPLLFLLGVSCAFDLEARLCWVARGHVLGMVLILLATGFVWPQTRYRLLASAAGVVWLAFALARRMAAGPNAAAGLTVATAFVLLSGAVAISWHKRWLLPAASAAEAETQPGPAQEEPRGVGTSGRGW